jgi:5-methylcytosine-specific restriction enzyme subunit McrC
MARDVRLRRTHSLVERTPEVCRLHRDDVEFLLTRHTAHIELSPTSERHLYRLTPAGSVGTIVCPRSRLVIQPKIPIRNLFHLLDPTGPIAVTDDHTKALPGAEGLDFLVGRLVQLLTERATAGLHRGYAERAEPTAFLVGALDVPTQLRTATAQKNQLHCRFEDFTVDVPCNQLPRATAERLLGSPLLGSSLRAALQRALQGWTGVRATDVTLKSFAALPADRLTESYRPLLDVCRLLIDGLTPGQAAGLTPCPAFLLDMDRVFEQYVTRALQESFEVGGRTQVQVQPLFAVDSIHDDQPDIQMRPDVVASRDGRALFVADAKWKDVARDRLLPADIYQVLAYCTALRARHGILVYPGSRDRAWSYRFARTVLEVRTVRVVGSRSTCMRSLRRFCQAARRITCAGTRSD